MVAACLLCAGCGEARPKSEGPVGNVTPAPGFTCPDGGVGTTQEHGGWRVISCGAGIGATIHLAGGDKVGTVYTSEYDEADVSAVEVHQLASGLLVCITIDWSFEAPEAGRLGEGWDTVCAREVSGALAPVFQAGDTSLADGSTSSYQVHGDEIHAIVECDDCELCMLEEDCDAVPEGTLRYITRHRWNGTAFVAEGEPVRQ